ncbi:MFS transporter [Leucobacter sp. G161]|uniref:MFS transporter n=1 Tax=Leucobacter sp. G161 TaxID=663704 RepID=UPI000A47B33D|nr:MFS transporter [Leucobacter sp. G161]
MHASEAAPFSFLGLSPAPIFAVVGIVLGQLFFMRTRARKRQGRVPLVDLDVLRNPTERAAVYAMFVIVAMEAAINFTVPTYIQVVQGRTPFDTSLAMMPFNLTVFVTATLIVRFYKRFQPRTIALFAFGLTTVALLWLALVATNNWGTLPTIVGLIAFGIGQGALVTLVFNVLVTAVPKELAGDVGSIRGTTQNLASAVGTAVMGAVLVTTLTFGVTQSVERHPDLPAELVEQVDLGNVNFVSNDDLRSVLAGTDASESQITAAVELHEGERLRTLKLGFLLLAGVSAIAALPASRLPRYRPEEIPE